MNFKDFFYNKNTQKTDEDIFYDVVGVKIPSLSSFIAWLILKNYIKPYYKDTKHSVPQRILHLPISQKINFLVKNVNNLKEKAIEFANTIY